MKYNVQVNRISNVISLALETCWNASQAEAEIPWSVFALAIC